MTVSWHSFDLVSGRRGPRVEVDALGSVQRIIGEPCTTALNVKVLKADGITPQPDWEPATRPGLTMLVAIDETEDDEDILWGGMTLRRVRTAAASAGLSVTTLEHYLARRFTGDFERINVDASTMAADVAAVANVDGIGLTIVSTPTGTTLSGRYLDYQDASVASVIDELMGLEGGVEYTVDLSWADANHTLLAKTLTIGPRIGTAGAASQWTMPGCLVDFEYVEDFGPDKGANDVTSISSGEGDARPSVRATDETLIGSVGWPRYERRFQPAPSITTDSTLGSYAANELERTRLGLSQLSIVAQLDAAPRLGSDWWLGDDINTAITAPSFPEILTPDGARVPGYTQRLRTVGYTIDLAARKMTPLTREVDA